MKMSSWSKYVHANTKQKIANESRVNGGVKYQNVSNFSIGCVQLMTMTTHRHSALAANPAHNVRTFNTLAEISAKSMFMAENI